MYKTVLLSCAFVACGGPVEEQGDPRLAGQPEHKAAAVGAAPAPVEAKPDYTGTHWGPPTERTVLGFRVVRWGHLCTEVVYSGTMPLGCIAVPECRRGHLTSPTLLPPDCYAP